MSKTSQIKIDLPLDDDFGVLGVFGVHCFGVPVNKFIQILQMNKMV